MNVVPIRPQNVAERHVQFSEFVDVRHFTPTETTEVLPTMHAQRLERQLRTAPCVASQPSSEPAQSLSVRAYKNVLHTAAMIFGALFIPSFACLILGPIGLIAPAVLLSLALICVLLGGRPTETMERVRAERAVMIRQFDPR